MIVRDPSRLSVAGLLAARAAEFPDHWFLTLADGETEGPRLTFPALAHSAAVVGAALRARIGQGGRVLVMMAPGLDYTVSILACAVAGVIAVPVPPPEAGAPPAALAGIEAIVKDCAPALVLSDPVVAGEMAGWPDLISALPRAMFADLVVGEAPRNAGNVSPGTVWVLLYTSGSTGQPKGVALTQANLIHAAWAMATDARLGPNSTFCVWLPGHHVSGLFSGIVLPLVAGGNLVGFPVRQFVEKPARWVQAIDRYRVTVTGAPTFAYEMVAQATTPAQSHGLDLSCVEIAVIGGEAVRSEVVDRFTSRFADNGLRATALYTMFGLTEAAMISTASGHGHGAARDWIDRDGLQQGMARPVPAGHAAGRAIVASGFPLPGQQVITVDPHSRAVQPDRVVGEVWIGGAAVGAGYWNNDAASEAAFRATTDDGQGPFLRTGDLAYIAEGQLHVVGRLKETIIIRGLNFYPDDLEATLRRADLRLATARLASFAAESGGREFLAIAIELPEEASLDATIRRAITTDHGIRVGALIHLPDNTIPMTPTGKIQRRRCAQLVASGAWAGGDMPPDGTIVDADDGQVLDRAGFAAMDAAGKRQAALPVLRRMVAGLTGFPEPLMENDRPLPEFGFDSITTVRFVLAVEDRFGRALSAAQLRDGLSLDELADLCSGIGRPAQAHRLPLPILPAEILPAGIHPARTPPGASETVLLTGGTGFLGTFLLRELLTQTGARVCCLVRAASAAAGHARLVEKLKDIGAWDQRFAARIEAIPGDLGVPRFGLEAAEFAALGARLHAIYHNGASVDFVSSYPGLKAANVDATLECLRLAAAGVLKPVHFTSTLAVFNSPDRIGMPSIGEGDHLDDPDGLRGGYAQSKWAAESLLTQAAARGMPVGIYRAGFIGGDTRTGYWNKEDFLCRMIRGSIQLGLYPDIAMDLPFVPVDAAARSIVALSRQPASGADIFHLMAAEPLSFSRLMAETLRAGYKLAPVPYERWLLILRDALPPENDLFAVLPFLIDPGNGAETVLDLYVRHAQPRWMADATRLRLAEAGLHAAPLQSAYFQRCIGGLANTLLTRAPEAAAARLAVPA
jgi:thioester reductase-like protein